MSARVLIILAAFLFAANQSASATDQNAAALRAHQFTVLRGTVVENYDGERLGTLKDFVLAASSGKVEFALIKSGGIGPISKERIVPSFCLSLNSVKEDTLSLDVTDTRWGAAPVFKRKHLQDLGNPAARHEVAGFYHFTGDTARAEQDAAGSLTPTGPASQAPAQNQKMLLASELVGRGIVNQSHKCLGKVCNLLIDASSTRDSFIVFSAPGFAKNHAFAIPFKSIQESDKGNLMVKLNEDDLAGAPLFDCTKPEEAAVYRYDVSGK